MKGIAVVQVEATDTLLGVHHHQQAERESRHQQQQQEGGDQCESS